MGAGGTPDGERRFDRDSQEFNRALAFFDATYAVALTLLVTTLEVDDPSSAWDSPTALFDSIGQQFIAFLIAFAVIASYWLANHRLVASFVAIDYPAIVANLLVVVAIVLLPFSTQAVGDPNTDGRPLPTVIMAVNVIAASGLHALVYGLALRRSLLQDRPTPRQFAADLIGSLDVAVVFAASIPVAYVASPATARGVWLTLVVISPLVGHLATRMHDRATASATR